MKRIGFLSFGHWSASPYSQVRSASDALIQSIELAEAVEEIGGDGAYFRVHHFAQQLASPFPLLAAIGARTKRIEIGTAVIDMRYENPLYMVEDAGAADLIARGRLELGISRGSPEQVIDGFRYFGYLPQESAPAGDETIQVSESARQLSRREKAGEQKSVAEFLRGHARDVLRARHPANGVLEHDGSLSFKPAIGQSDSNAGGDSIRR